MHTSRFAFGGVGFDHDAGTSVSCSDRVDPHGSRESKRRHFSPTHCQAVSKTAGSDGNCIQRDTPWPAVHETPTVVAQDQGVLPEGKPASHAQGHVVMPNCLRHVEETLVLVSGPGAGRSLSPRNASDGRVPHRLGSGHEWPLGPRSVERSSSHMAHQLPGDAGRVSSTETLSPRPKRLPCVGVHQQHSGGLLHQPQGRSAFAPLLQAGAPDLCVVPGQTPLAESSAHPWASQCGSRHPNLESVLTGSGGPVCDSRDIALSPFVLSNSSSSSQTGCYGKDLAEASSVCLSPDRSGESAPGRGPSAASSPVLARPSIVLGPDFSPRRLSLGDSSQEGSPLTSGGYDPSPLPGVVRVVEAVGVAPEGTQLIASGLSTEVVETILQSRAPSVEAFHFMMRRPPARPS